jgi:hypothetical protein
MTDTQWLPIEGCPHHQWRLHDGDVEVRSLDRMVSRGDCQVRTVHGQLLKPHQHFRDTGLVYWRCSTGRTGRYVHVWAHRLLADLDDTQAAA